MFKFLIKYCGNELAFIRSLSRNRVSLYLFHICIKSL